MDATGAAGAPGRPYHHGDLRRALLEAALAAIGDDGAANVRLRDVARRAGVSHAAPSHHFGDKAGLLTAVAVDGFELLTASLGRAYDRTGSLLEVGVAYVSFAVSHRAHFAVMFRPELYDADDPSVVEARRASAEALYGPISDVVGVASPDRPAACVAAWSLVHGLATLVLTDNLPGPIGDDVERLARRVVGQLVLPSAAP